MVTNTLSHTEHCVTLCVSDVYIQNLLFIAWHIDHRTVHGKSQVYNNLVIVTVLLHTGHFLLHKMQIMW